jgi:hypothetical protein
MLVSSIMHNAKYIVVYIFNKDYDNDTRATPLRLHTVLGYKFTNAEMNTDLMRATFMQSFHKVLKIND